MRVSLGLLFLFSGLVFGQADHLVFSEVVLTPSDGEYVQITNPTANDIDMSDYYLTDATDGSGNAYYNLPSGSGYWSGCLLYTSPSPRDVEESRMPSSA